MNDDWDSIVDANEQLRATKALNKAQRAKKPRKKKPASKLEGKVVDEIIKYLKSHPRVLRPKRVNTGKVKTAWGSWVMLAPTGTPDIDAFLDNGKVLVIEAKAPGGTYKDVTDKQREYIADVVAAGGCGFWANSKEMAQEKFEEYLSNE